MIRIIVFLFILCPVIAYAVDKSGVSPNVVSLPSGPGSIEGLGAEYQPQLNTGTAAYSVPLRLPPGTAGHTPSLSLTYEGGNGNGPLGLGWSLPVLSIRRQCDKGLPHYHPNGEDDDFDGDIDEVDEEDRFLDPKGEELVLTDRGYYYPENQEQFLRWYRRENHWEGRQPDGTLLELGLTPTGRIEDGSHTFAWLLEKETDTRGNVIEYRYAQYHGSEQQRYLREIRYGPGAPPWKVFYTVVLTHEDRPDAFDDYRSGFLVRNGKRIARIEVALQGILEEGHLVGDINADGTQDALIRRYELRYETHSHWSQLSRVVQVGADGVSALPPAVFSYAIVDPSPVTSARDAILVSRGEPVKVMDNPLVELIDLNADGLPDILATEQEGGSHSAYLNEGLHRKNGQTYLQWSAPQEVGSEENEGRAWALGLADEVVSLADMDGDGLADLVSNPTLDPNPRYFRNLGKVAWGPQERMSVEDVIPPAPFGNKDVRHVDMDFDKHTDIVKSIPDGYQIWYNRGKDRSGSARYSRMLLTPGAYDQESVIQFSDPGAQLADLNGDRILDVVRIDPTGMVFCPSQGYGKFDGSIWIPLPADDGFGHDSGFNALTDEPGGQRERTALQDITGDGLADLVLERAAPGELWYWINLGNTAFSQRRIVTDLPTVFSTNSPTVRWADLNGNGTSDLIYADSGLEQGERLQTVDIGLLNNGSAHPNLLIRIENGIGKTVRVEYRPTTEIAAEDAQAGQPWKYPLPNPVHVIRRLRVQDGLGHEYVTEFRYRDGYYDGAEKEFRGFGEAEQKEIGDESQPTLISRYTFDTGASEESLKGKPLRVVVQTEDGKIFHEEENSLSTRRLYLTLPPPPNSLEPIGVTFPYVSRTLKTLREEPSGATEPVSLEIEYAYDNYGNRVKEAIYGRVQNGVRHFGEDERVSWTVYSATPESAIWNLPVEVVTTDDATPPKIAAYAQLFYDGLPFQGLPLGQLERGNLMRQRGRVAPQPRPQPPEPTEARYLSIVEKEDHTLNLTVQDRSGQTVAAHEDHWIDTVRHQFDVYGNKTAAADPLARIQGDTPDAGAGHYRQYQYDPQLHLYPVEERILVGNNRALVLQAEYNLGLGVVTQSWDYNHNPTQYGYDPFARITKIMKPGGTPPDSLEMPTTSYTYTLAEPFTTSEGETRTVNWIEARTHEEYGDPDAYYVTRTFVDGLGRTVLTKEEDENPDRVVVKQAVLFNQRKQPYRTLLPFYSAQDWAFEEVSAPGWTGTWAIGGQLQELSLTDSPHVDVFYDPTGRPVRTVQPDDTFARTVYGPLTEQSFDEEDSDPLSQHYDTPTVRYRDGLERLIGIEETARLDDEGRTQSSRVAWLTRYRYDLLDNIVQVTDSQNNLKTLLYDALKRRVFMNDPDRGMVYYTYDDASNLIETVDAKQQRITYAYDGVNRLLTEDYHDEGQPFSFNRTYDPSLPLSDSNRPDVAYFYDEPAGLINLGNGEEGTARNTQGFLSYAIDLSGEEHTSYDERGRVVWEVKKIPDPQNGVKVAYKTETVYDALDRVTQLIYPDEDRVSFAYNSRSFLESIGGPSVSIVPNIDYVPSQKMEKLEYGNQVVTNFAYDRRNRIQAFNTFPRSAPESTLLHYAYTHDAVSNLTRIDDLWPGTVGPAGDKRRDTQVYDYDDLYRLTQVQYSFALPGEEDRNDGRIEYRYDRIGNLLGQASSIEHNYNDHSITNLGALSYGSAKGAWGRNGKDAEAPGPHALTSMDNGTDARSVDYDPSGNMTRLQDYACTWDFKDRLLSIENDQRKISHTYDYTNRRISKVVREKGSNGEEIGEPTAAIYVNKYYEVREHDQAVKYVFNGSTRVAQITGTLDTTAQRVQRHRLYRGWNLLSLVVDAPDAAKQIGVGINPNIQSAYCWEEESREFVSVQPDDTLPAGTVLWIYTETEDALAIKGIYQEPDTLSVPQGGQYLVPNRLEAIAIERLLFPDTAQIWYYDSFQSSWFFRSMGDFSFLSNGPEILRPGQPIYIHNEKDLNLTLPSSEDRIRYFHPNHLGSTAILTDAQGAVLEETAYYPFGYPRYRKVNQEGVINPNYLFTQKEWDRESGLMYFDARFYCAELGRFLSVDPLIGQADPKNHPDPQSRNLYAYVQGNPVKYIDPSGKVIFVAEDSSGTFRAEVQSALQKIDPSAYVNEYGIVSFDKSVKVTGHAKGHKLLARMVSNKNKIVIGKNTSEEEDHAQANDPRDAVRRGIGTGGTIRWSPNSSIKSDVLKEGVIWEDQIIPPSYVLGHELIHGDRFQRGEMAKDHGLMEYTGLDDEYHKAPLEEIMTMGFGYMRPEDITEQDLAREAGWDPRVAYWH